VVLEESMRGRGFVGIGLMLHPLFDPGGKLLFGVKVTQVMPEFPGAKAGLKAGDLITGVDDLALDDQEADQKFMDFIGKKGPGKTVTLKISRNGEGKEYKVTLARRPDNLESRKAQDPEELFQAFLARRRADPGPK
jgi:C-terminal processing protease CtpA/Prc